MFWTWSLQEQVKDQIQMDEQLSMAAADAIQDCFQVATPMPQIQLAEVWKRFLLSVDTIGVGIERFPAAVLTNERGMYQYTLKEGWSELCHWQGPTWEERTLQMESFLQESCDEAGSQYRIQLPLSAGERWAEMSGDQCLIVLYLEPGRSHQSMGEVHVVVGGARCVKEPLYLVQCQEDDIWLYHRPECAVLEDPVIMEECLEAYYSMEECAGRGAYPCPDCLKR